ncbi:bifunctional DNA-formamidopyrimidine glycosylase/DNA-(apurinic or apyrimidinic site) lyase [Patescibacteria group bacterium]|nr:bifunctional DNA-formamidopyrimidine glycosylase/DNA-(apurinic or apyrimidinic site) lyase [Patescibacteria group bacterium]MBU1074540.1 bifunctional DNA-formamidopyrimidine glycosylase/DNA-(apurinic or apyrimidinic site) lyase [Patescibacteria group bacterium]MBU1951508.1 bifunctional DNA-formamidopyrimidine glycosylase/DNA-(apurinic or apyrimidinic site) lyase [Patescibacteria group bacterium]
MPELPEVQTIVSDLNRKLKGHRIQKIWTDWPKSFYPSVVSVRKGISEKKIFGVRRRAKNILIDFAGNMTLLVHLKMTGHLLYRSSDWMKNASKDNPFNDPFNQFIRTIFYLDKNMELAFSDLRRFGEIKLFKTSEENSVPRLKKLGPEPLSPSFTNTKFQKVMENKKGMLKSLLLNQNVISGIGNIYADEILWEAKLGPKKRVDSLTSKQIRNLHQSIRKILKKAVECRGTSISDYRDASGKKGSYQKIRRVYKRDGENCFRCETKLRRTKVNNRGTTFCPQCQK